MSLLIKCSPPHVKPVVADILGRQEGSSLQPSRCQTEFGFQVQVCLEEWSKQGRFLFLFFFLNAVGHVPGLCRKTPAWILKELMHQSAPTKPSREAIRQHSKYFTKG